jgi:polar amino acid transport system substrate-binding protein
MLQAIQYQKTGKLHVKELPAPELKPKMIIVRTVASLISAGTERTSVATAQASTLEKIRTRPDLVKQVLDMAKREGWMSTIEKVRTKLDSYKALGYAASGEVIASLCDEFSPGDRVACAGGGYASHAEILAVPRNLAVKIPEGVSYDEAAFTTLGAIAMQGVRQAKVSLGESVAVIGLGLLGQITLQLLKAAGCRVIGLDINERQFALAREFGADALLTSNSGSLPEIENFTRGIGCDAVIITAGTNSNEPVELAIKAARKRGRLVVVGAVGMNLPRAGFYEKELEVTIACSYGPGRYDPSYEEEGNDYPVGYVRWTERRNMESVLDLMAAGRLNVERIITHRIPILEAQRAYDIITGKIVEPYMGILLKYPDRGDQALLRTVQVDPTASPRKKGGDLGVGFIGAGSFAQSYLIPPAKREKARLVSVMTSTSVNARSVAEKFGFSEATTDADTLLANPAIDALFIATRHDTHGDYVARALEAGKQVFVEKPLAINRAELERIRGIATTNDRLMVGFNRRFSDPLLAMEKFFAQTNEPKTMLYRVNAGFIPPDNWIQAEAQGGRIIGEGCHFIDAMSFISGGHPTSVHATAIGSTNMQVRNADSVSITIRFSDGSVGTLHYLANGDPSIPKEYFEVFAGGSTAIMNNFKTLTLARGRKSKTENFSGDKGHSEEVRRTLRAMSDGGPMPISFASLSTTTEATIAAVESLETGESVRIGDEE